MRKVLTFLIVGLLCFSTFSILGPQVKAESETIIYEDDFETYDVGTFPHPPWDLWFNGQGSQHQVVVDTVSVSGSKSLKLWGRDNWGAHAAKLITIPEKIGFEALVRVENWGLSGKVGAHISLAKNVGYGVWGWGSVGFTSNGYITSTEGNLQPYDLNTWYKVTVIFDVTSNTHSVWIDDVLRGTSLMNSHPSSEIEALILTSDHAEQVCYFDDAKVFGVSTLPAGAWHPHSKQPDSIDSARLDRIDLDSMTPGDQQYITVESGEDVTIDYSAWLVGNPGEIRQFWFVYSWASSYPPWDVYTPIYNGQPYPSKTVQGTFSITAPSTAGTYKVWLCVESKYNMNEAVAEVTEEPAMLPHALVVVGANLVKNPGFEQQLDYWSVSMGTATFTADTGNPRSGSYSAKGVELQEGSLGRLYQDMTGIAHAGGEYKISGWIKTQNVVGWVVIALDYVAANGWTPADGYVREIGYVTDTQDWTYYESDVFTLPPMPSDASAVWFLFDFNAGKGTAWWDDVSLIEVTPPEALDPWEYCPYVYLDNGYGLPWETTSDLPVNVFYTGTYFWGDLRVIQYWFHWNIDYMWWPFGFAKSAYEYTMGRGWDNPLRQTTAAAGGADWEPIIVIVDDSGAIDCVLWRWHYNWLKFDLSVPGAELFHPTYGETHLKLWWVIGSHTPLTKYFAVDIPILLDIASWLRTPEQFKTALGQYGDFTKPPFYELHEQGITYPCGMQEWDEDLALDLGFNPSDLVYVNNPTIAYSELQPWELFDDFLSLILGSPANILVTAPNGLRVGYDSATQTTVNEIAGATYSGPGTEPQAVYIPSPLPGVYNVDVIGTDTGVCTITIWSMAEDGSVAGFETHVGDTVEGAEYAYSVSITEETMTVNPNPAVELEHFKEFFDGLPDDCFDQSIRRASHLKKALFSKIDEVILKVDVDNYTDAINKLFRDIRAKMDGDSTAEDWIVDPETRSDLCVIIDHIISNIETLQQR